MRRPTRRTTIATTGLALLSGCLNQLGRADETGETDPPSQDGGDVDTGDNASEYGDEQLEKKTNTGLPTTNRDLPLPANKKTMEDEMQRVTAKDAIPAVDDPEFMDSDAADEHAQIDPGDPVFGMERNGDAKAYPQHMLVWHEIVNDRIGGDPVAVTYCPLTGTVQGFERGGVEFGVSGLLLNSNLVMYDRSTESYWPQMLAVALTGPHKGEELVEFNVTWTTWKRWSSTYPDTLVLRNAGKYLREMGRDPYGSYNPPEGHYSSKDLLYPKFSSGSERDIHPKRVFLGARTADGALAVAKDTLADAGLVKTNVGGTPYVVSYDSELHTGWFYRNPEGLAVSRKNETVTVDGTEYESDKLPLKSVVRYDTMWFAWEGYYPETEVYI